MSRRVNVAVVGVENVLGARNSAGELIEKFILGCGHRVTVRLGSEGYREFAKYHDDYREAHRRFVETPARSLVPCEKCRSMNEADVALVKADEKKQSTLF